MKLSEDEKRYYLERQAMVSAELHQLDKFTPVPEGAFKANRNIRNHIDCKFMNVADLADLLIQIGNEEERNAHQLQK